MNITTRYSIGDTVWHLRTRRQRRKVTCPLCGGKGRVPIGDTDRDTHCPDCRWGGVYETDRTLMGEIARLTIGQVRAEVEGDRTEITYMAWETGVGSGSILAEANLYPTRKDAEQACADAGAVLLTPSERSEAIA
ncbi:MAG TPA: hypothetical protein VFJ21_03815 [Mycobacteriales bacterium]|nr:hypothetical protein [Mycobacteriales bacterium]